MTTLCSYDLNGKKLSFANWISNLSPQETPFTSMTGKESINQTLFQWQTDTLAAATKNAVVEGADAADGTLATTKVLNNVTQILRKTVKVSDTANALANYGRGRELQYQMEKAGKEIKRDLEYSFLNNLHKVNGSSSAPAFTAGFAGLCAVGVNGAGKVDLTTSGMRKLAAATGTGTDKNYPAPDTGAVTAFASSGAVTGNAALAATALTEKDLFDMTMQLYLSGSKANIIMYHPRWASFFSGLQEKAVGGNRQRIFENTPKFSVYVSTIVDPLGQEYKLIPNRWMPESAVFFLNTSDWTQMVLRAPSRTKLAKDGSYEKWMLEMEVGLRHRNPYASGILVLGNATAAGKWHGNGSAVTDFDPYA